MHHGSSECVRTHFEIIEHVEVSDEAAQELAESLDSLSLIEDHTYGGYMIASYRNEEDSHD